MLLTLAACGRAVNFLISLLAVADANMHTNELAILQSLREVLEKL